MPVNGQDPGRSARKARARTQPMACGIAAARVRSGYLLVVARAEMRARQNRPRKNSRRACKREKAIENQVVVDTPDPWLNAGGGRLVQRGGRLFSRRHLHPLRHALVHRAARLADRFRRHGLRLARQREDDAKLFIATQITGIPVHPAARRSRRRGLSSQAPDSRMFGKGRIDPPRSASLRHAEPVLRPDRSTPGAGRAIPSWRSCSGPRSISTANTSRTASIPTAWASTRAMPTPGRRTTSGTTAAAPPRKPPTPIARKGPRCNWRSARATRRASQLHAAAVERIHKGFFDLLWIPSKGYPGAYREQSGLKRLHESGWLYAIFCPIDAGLLDDRAGGAGALLHRVGAGADEDALRRRAVLALELGAVDLVGARDVVGR